MESISGQFRKMVGDMRPKLERARKSAGEGRALMREVLDLAKDDGIRDIVAGNTEAVNRRKARIHEAIQAMRRVEREWLRGQLIDRAGSVLVRFAFVEAFFPYLFDEEKVPDLETFSSKRLGVFDQAWLWGIVQGPKELYDALRLARMDESLVGREHLALLRRFWEVCKEVETVIDSIADRYPKDALNISGDKRDSLQVELHKLRKFIEDKEEKVGDLSAKTPPSQ